jgi:peroxiredoxin
VNAEFRAKEDLRFELVSDPSRRLITELGIVRESEQRGQIARRVTYLLDADGTIRQVWELGPDDIDTHADAVLAAIRD